MERVERVAVLENEIEALVLGAELDARDIPHGIMSYHDTAFDGLFQFTRGWGEVQAPTEFRDEILTVLQQIREARSHSQPTTHDCETGED